ncbi:uncharacterized protein G2W53_028873 [Senna tora]|uniref:Uncharacterized protein n=1 Tax=Senna tora TaxID=362788 RepID=A0A834TD09_9FABA|nr:uncharacterized protein G2W53_028873 [Senna tora]
MAGDQEWAMGSKLEAFGLIRENKKSGAKRSHLVDLHGNSRGSGSHMECQGLFTKQHYCDGSSSIIIMKKVQ